MQEWRAGQEPTPWATGIALAVFSALVVGVAVWVLSAGLADRPVIAVLVNLLVAGGLGPGHLAVQGAAGAALDRRRSRGGHRHRLGLRHPDAAVARLA